MSKSISGFAAFAAASLVTSALTGCEATTSNGYFVGMPSSATSTDITAPTASTTPVSPGGTSSGGTTSVCTPQMAQNLRIVFLVDASGSTQSDDSGAKIRVGSLTNFINSNLAATNLSYSLNYFAYTGLQNSYDYTTSKFVSSSGVAASAFGGASATLTAATTFQNTYASVATGKGTDYQAALASLGNIIKADDMANPGKYSYAVVFMSDGQPNQEADSTSSIDTLVSSLVSTVGATRLTLSSVYFNSTSSTSDESIIDNMAITGKGQYVNGTTDNLNLKTMIQGILNVPTAACPTT